MSKLARIKLHVDGSKLGWTFKCPGCDSYHQISDSWTCDGNLEAPTISPSVLCTSTPNKGSKRVCHSFVRKGMIEFLSDCTHKLAGQTVELPDVDLDSPFILRAE